MNLAETAELSARLSLDTSNFDRGVGRAIGGLSRFQAAMGRVGTGVGQLARGGFRILERGLLALGAAMVYGGKQAIDFEDAFAGVARTLSDNVLPGQLEQIRKGLLALSLQLPITQVELANIAEVAGTAGIAADDIVKFTEAIARLSKVTDLSVGTITPTVAKLMQVLHIGTDEIDNFFSALSQASIIAPATDQEMILAAERFASLAQQIGFTRDEIIALSTVAVSFGQRPEAAGTAVLLVMQRTVRNLAEGGKKLELFAKISGQTAAAVKQQWATDPFEGMLNFLEGFRRLSAGEQALVSKELGFSTARIGQLLANMALNIPRLREYNTQITKADKEGQLFLELSDKRFTTTRNHLILLLNNVKDLGIAFGEGLGIDKATGALDRFITRLIAFLQTNREAVKQLGVDVGRFLDNISFAGLRDDATKVINVLHNIGDLIKLIPKDWLYLGAALVGLNKLSGGLLALGTTNILGGLIGGITAVVAKAVGNVTINRLIPQPVIVMAFSPLAQAQLAGGGLAGGLAGGAAGAGAAGVAGFFAGKLPLGLAALIVAAGAIITKSKIETAAAFGRGETTPASLMNNPLADLLGLPRIGEETVDATKDTTETVKRTHQEALDVQQRLSAAHLARLEAFRTTVETQLGPLDDILGAIKDLKPKLEPLVPTKLGFGNEPRVLQSSAAILELMGLEPEDVQATAKIFRDLAVLEKTGTQARAKLVPLLNDMADLLTTATKTGNLVLAAALAAAISETGGRTGITTPTATEAQLGLVRTINGAISTMTTKVGSVLDTIRNMRLPTPRVNLRFGNPINRTTVNVTIGTRTVTKAIYSGGGYGPAYVYGGNQGQLYEGPW